MVGPHGSVSSSTCLDLAEREEGLGEVGRIVGYVEEVNTRQEWQVADMGGLARPTDAGKGGGVYRFHLA